MRTACLSQQLFRCVLLLFGLSLAWSGNAGEPGPVIPKGKGDHCVADTDFMRRNHMDLIVHQRDETVIRGIRDEPFSLVECVDCHAQKDASNNPVRVDEEGQFCASCHSYVAVKIDCFGCHAAVPDVDTPHKTGSIDSTHWLPHKRMLASKFFLNPQLNPALERDRNELNNTSE